MIVVEDFWLAGEQILPGHGAFIFDVERVGAVVVEEAAFLLRLGRWIFEDAVCMPVSTGLRSNPGLLYEDSCPYTAKSRSSRNVATYPKAP